MELIFNILVDDDYQSITPSEFEITLGLDAAPLSIDVPIVDDEIFEQNEVFTANLRIIGTSPQRVQVSRPTTVVTIFDDDGMPNNSLQ